LGEVVSAQAERAGMSELQFHPLADIFPLMEGEVSSTRLALEQAEAEKRRRANERIEKGEAIRLQPVVVGNPCRAAAEKARKIAALRAAGERREIVFGEPPNEYGLAPISVIATGVPRPDRDGNRCENCTCRSSEPIAYLPGARLRASHELPPRPVREPTPELPIPTEWWPFRVQIRAGNGGDDPGQIIEGRYGVVNDLVYVENDQGKPVDMQRLGPNENPAGVAQKLLREKWRNRSPNAPAGFYEADINRKITFH
jgi:hypothetical protein